MGNSTGMFCCQNFCGNAMYFWNVRLSTHRARETIDLLRRPAPDYIAPDMWMPNSPDLNPVDYSIWSVMQQHVYHSRVNDVDDLRERLISVWCKLDQSVVNHAIDKWRR